MCFTTTEYRCGFLSLFGSSADTISSNVSGAIIFQSFFNMIKKCACGSPLFVFSITYTYAATAPNTCFLNNSIFYSSNFALKTRAIKSSQFCASSPNRNSCLIFGQFGLHVIVRKISSFPKHCTNAIASMYLFHISLGPPRNEASKIILRPTLEPCVSPT